MERTCQVVMIYHAHDSMRASVVFTAFDPQSLIHSVQWRLMSCGVIEEMDVEKRLDDARIYNDDPLE